MLAVAQDKELDRGATSVAPGTSAPARSRVGEAGPRTDPLCRRPGRDGCSGREAQAAGPGPVGDRNADTVEQAVKRRVFGRGFKRDVRVPDDLPDQVERLLERAALDALAIAGKAGL